MATVHSFPLFPLRMLQKYNDLFCFFPETTLVSETPTCLCDSWIIFTEKIYDYFFLQRKTLVFSHYLWRFHILHDKLKIGAIRMIQKVRWSEWKMTKRTSTFFVYIRSESVPFKRALTEQIYLSNSQEIYYSKRQRFSVQN